MSAENKLVLRYEFSAGSGVCLWAANAQAEASLGDAIEAEALPVSDNLRYWLRYLIAWYDTSLDWDDPGAASTWSDEERQRFRTAAQRGLAALRHELPTQFELQAASLG